MAVYQGTPLPRARGRQTGPRPPTASPRVAERPPVPVRMLSRPMTPAYGSTLPRAAVPREDLARHGARLRVVAAPRPRTALAGVATVLVLTLVGLFYLSQTFEAAAARYEVDALRAERQVMLQELRSQQGATVVWGSEATVGQWAQRSLDRLGSRYRVRAR